MDVRRLLMTVLGSFVLGSLLFTAPALADNVVVVGGWSEDSGYFTTLPASRAGQPQHTGQTEQRSVNGTTNKRAHGWTTWVGQYHFTRACMEHNGMFCNGQIITDSQRQWGFDGTEAISPWTAFNPNKCCGNLGSGRTYYGLTYS